MVFEVDVRQRIFAGEGGRLKPAESGNVVGAKAILPLIGRQNARLKHVRHRACVAGLRPDGGKSIGRTESLVGPIEDLPVDELAATAEADAARSDAAQGKGNHAQLASA